MHDAEFFLEKRARVWNELLHIDPLYLLERRMCMIQTTLECPTMTNNLIAIYHIHFVHFHYSTIRPACLPSSMRHSIPQLLLLINKEYDYRKKEHNSPASSKRVRQPASPGSPVSASSQEDGHAKRARCDEYIQSK
jgi:hypothetical protein